MPRVTAHPFFVESPEAFGEVYGESLAGSLFETDDLVLAGYLLSRDYEGDTVVWKDGRCHWFFVTPDDPSLIAADAIDFHNNDASVEPKRLHRMVNTARAGMIEADPNRRRR